MRGPDPPTIWNVGKQGHSSDQHYLFLIIMGFPFALLLWALKTQVTFRTNTLCLFFRSFCTHFVLILLLKHIILRSISLFWLLFKSLFSFCLNKMVRSIIVKGGVSRDRVVVKDSNDWSRLPGHWSRSVILTFTATHSLIIFSWLSKCWDTLVPSCILLGKNRCRRHWMFTIVTESYILFRVYHLSHADSMSPTETSTLSLTTISSFEELFFYYRCRSYAFFCCSATTTSLDWRSH